MQSADGTTHNIVITINGTNDAAVISGTETGVVTEDAAGTLTTSGALTISDTDSGEGTFTAETVAGSYGSLTIDESGNWSYSADNSQNAIQSLGDGDQLTDTLTVQSADGTTHNIVITINGTNDAAVISGTETGAVTEDSAGTLITSGTLSVSDADSGEAAFTAETVSGNYGSLTIDESGNWSYSADNTQSTIQALGDGDQLTDTLTVQSTDGTTHNIVITINGTNDTAVIGGIETGTVTEDSAGTLTTSGALTISDTDAGEVAFTAETVSGSYGSLTIDESGNWSYSANNSQNAIQSLGDGDQLTDTLTVQSADGTTHNIVITINGTNDAAFISGIETGTVTEDSAGTLTTSGYLDASDADSGEGAFNAETVAGSYGSLTIDESGNWSYSADNSQNAIQSLGDGDQLTDTLTVQSADGTTHNIVITINGTNDAAVISGTETGAVTEDSAGTLITSGTLSVSDADSGEAAFTAETVSGNYGSLTIDESGNWSYSADNSQNAIQSLGDGDQLTDTLTVQSADGTTHNIVITINGTNDAAVISGTETGAVTEDSAGTLITSGTLSVSDADSGEAAFTAETVSGNYGSLTIDESGNWSYSADNTQSTIQALGDGDQLTDTLTVQSTDGTTHNIVITINGTNDTAVIGGIETGTVTEDSAGTLTTSGALTISDTDAGEVAFSAETVSGSYGSLTIDESGNWSYSADNSQSAVQSLGDGEQLTDTLTVQSADGTTHNIVITINGANDAAFISGIETGTVTEDAAGTLTTSGYLDASDADSGEGTFTAETVSGSYGSLTIDESGNWSYSADNSQNAIQALGDGDQLTDTLTVQTVDGTTQTIVININGTNDTAIIGGTDTGAVTEDSAGTLTTSGALTISDTDTGEAAFSAETITGSYGSLTIDESGNWSYSANNSQNAIQALGDGDQLTDTLTVQSADGTTHNIVISINGTNDAAVISGTETGAITEDSAGTLTTSGALTISDTDSGEGTFTAETVLGSYGSLTIDESGNWSYSADNTQSTIQALGDGDQLTDTLTVQSVDGTTHSIVITINGTNDAAVISGTETGAVTEDAAGTLTTSGALTISDTDSGEGTFTAETVSGSYGSLTIDESGNWSYSADNSQNAIQALGDGDQLTDTLTVQSADGTTHNIVITIDGTNDAAVISGAETGAITEDAAGTLTTSGALTISDTDSGEGAFNTETVAGSYGSLIIDESGNWSYSANNSQNAIQALGDGDQLTDTLTVQSADGTTHNIVITINGTNDAAVISGTETGAVTEDAAGTLTTSGYLDASDADSDEGTFTAETVSGSYGSLTIDESGNWSYSADNSQNAIQALGDGDQLTDTLTVQSADGTTHNIVITINGTNDAAVISGTETGAVTEDSAGTLITSGTLSVSDTDSGEGTFTAETVSGSYGSLTIDESGNWSYSADNSQSAVQSLGNGDQLTDTLTVQSADGTTHNIVITINGTNDAAFISGIETGTVTEDAAGTLTTSGYLDASDADSGEGTFTAETVSGSYGSLTIDESGNWSYSADNSQSAVQSLGNGDQLTDTLTVQSADGTTHNIVITINGTNDAAFISGIETGTVTEDAAGTLTTSGYLDASDADSGEGTFTAETVSGSYGSLTIDESGNWSYSADNTQNAIQSLGASDQLTDTLTVQSADGTTHNIVITINGTNDAAFISGTETGAITEDSAGTLTTSGALTISDTDSGEGTFTAETVAGSYGSLTIDESGNWNYSADNSQNVIQSLGDGDQLTDTLTVQTVDGTTQTITVTINGTNDAAVIGGTETGMITEDSAGTLATSGTLTISEADSGEANFTAETIAGTYGSLTIDVNGNWDYTTDNTQSAIQSLAEGETLTDTLSIQSVDGTTHNVIITINGANDIASSSDQTVTLNEDSTYTFSTTDFSFTDTDSSDSLQSITITQLPVNGELQLNGVTVNANDTIFTSDIGNLTFTPAANINGAASASFQFAVSDGIADSPAQTLTFDITAVDDAPTTPTAEISQFDFTWGGGHMNDRTADTYTLPSGFTLGDAVWVHKEDDYYRKAVKVQISDNGDGTLNFKAIAAAYTWRGTWNSLSAEQQETFFESGSGSYASVATSNSQNGYGIRDVAVHGGTPVPGFLDSVIGVDIHPFFAAENGVDGAVVGTVSSTDFDGDTITYSLSNNAGGRFAIDSSTGEITVADSSLLDYETTTSHTVTVEVSDGNLTSSQDYSIYLQDTDDAPVIASSIDLGSIDEDNSIVITEAQLLATASDADGDNLSITSLTLNDSNHGVITDNGNNTWTFTPAENLHGDNIPFSFTVSDGTSGDEASGSATIDITAVADAPVISPDTSETAVTEWDFENVTISNANWQAVTSAPSGWSSDSGSFEFQSDGYGGNTAYEGGQWLELDTNSHLDSISYQADTSEGQPFIFEFATKARNSGATDDFEIYWAGELITTISPTNAWAVHRIELPAVDQSHALLTIKELSDQNDSHGGLLDALKVLKVGISTSDDPLYDYEISSLEDTAIPLNLGTITSSGTETITTSLAGIPAGSVLSDGSNSVNADGSDINITGWNLSGLSLTPPADRETDFTITINATATESNGDSALTSQTLRVNLLAASDAAVIGGTETGTVTEDSAGTLATSGALTISDPDSGEAAFTAETIAGTYGSLTIDANGNWDYTADNTQSAIQSLAEGETLTDTLSIQSVDGTTHDVVITINGANDIASSSDQTVTLNEDSTYSFSAADFSFTDTDSSDSLQSITITQLPVNGELQLNGVTVNANDTIFPSDIGNLTFTPIANISGAASASLQFTVSDGIADSPAQTLTFDITAVNDAPIAPTAEISQFDFTWGGGSIDDKTADTYSLPSGFTPGDAVWVHKSDGGSRKAVKVQISDNGDGTFNFKAIAAAYTTESNWNSLTAGQQETFFESGGGSSQSVATSDSEVGYGIRDVAVHGGTPVPGFLDSVTGVDIHPFFAAENGVDGAVVGTVSSTDIDGDTLTFSLSDNAGGRFAIDSATGEITVADSSLLDYETTTSHTITVEVSDGNLTSSRDYSIYLQDTNDAPVVAPVDRTTSEDTNFILSEAELLTYASDVEGDTLSISNLRVGSGQVTIIDNGNSTWTITPASDWSGGAQLLFDVSDGTTTVTGQVDVSVTAQADTPELVIEGSTTITSMNFNNGLESGWTSENWVETYGSGGPLGSSPTGSAIAELDNGAGGNPDAYYYSVDTSQGHDHEISLWVKQRHNTGWGDSTDDIEIVWNGEVLQTIDPPTTWQEVKILLPDTGQVSTQLAIREVASQNNSNGPLLDSIEILRIGADDSTDPAYDKTLSSTEDTRIALDLTASLTDSDGSETLTTTLAGIPSGFGLSDGSNSLTTDGGTVDISGWDLANLTLTPVANHETDFTLTVTATATESSGETATTSQTIFIDIEPVQDAAVISGDDAGSVSEDDNATLMTSGSLSANDVDTGESTFTAETVIGTYGSLTIDANGNWDYTADNTQSAIQSLAEGEALTDTLSIQSFDGTTHDVVITINGANDIASSSDQTVALNEDSTYTFSAADFSFTDTDSSDSLQSITITQLPVNGELQLNGVTVNANDTIFTSDIGNLTFTPAANINGAASASFQFAVSDGIADSPAQTLTFDITAVDDAPTTPTAEISQFDFTWGGGHMNDRTADTYTLPSGFTLGDAVWVHKEDDYYRKAVKVQISDNGDGTLNFKAIAAAYTWRGTWNSLSAEQQETFFESGSGSYASVATSNSQNGYGIRDVAVHGGTPVPGFLDSVTGIDIHPFFAAENGVDGAVVGTVSSTDFDGDTVTYSLSNNAGGRFAIDSSTGEITVADSSLLDYETTTSHTITVEVSDGNLTSSQDYSIYVKDINEAPVIASSIDLGTIDEDNSIVITEAQLLATASDINGDNLSITSLSLDDSGHGSVVDNGNGTWTFNPTSHFSGDNIGFNFIVSDGTPGDEVTGTATLDINGVVDTPELSSSLEWVDGEVFNSSRVSGWSTTGTHWGTNVGESVNSGFTASRMVETHYENASYTLKFTGYGVFQIEWNGQIIGYIDSEPPHQDILIPLPGAGLASFTELKLIATEHGSIGSTTLDVVTEAVDVTENTSIALDITAALVDTDGSETHQVVLSNLPDGATISDGTNSVVASGGEVDISGWNYGNVTFTPPANESGTYNLQLTATSSEGGQQASDSLTMQLNVVPIISVDTSETAVTEWDFENVSMSNASWQFVTSAPSGWSSDSGNFEFQSDGLGGHTAYEGNQWLELDTNNHLDSISYQADTSEGKPFIFEFATKAHGSGSTDDFEIYWAGELITTISPTNTWALHRIELPAVDQSQALLTIKEPADQNNGYGALLDALKVLKVGISVSDDPLYDYEISSLEDTAIPFNLVTTISGNIEAITTSLAGIPAGSVLSDGSNSVNADGSDIDITGWNLSGLSLTPPADRETDFTITINATATESDGDSTLTSRTLRVNLLAASDTAVISGTETGSVTEDSAGTLATSGALTISDPDSGEAAFTAETIAGTYGSLTIDANGNWDYTADNTQSAIQSLAEGEALTDTLSVQSVDGTTHDVVITINGANDIASSSDQTVTLNEDSTYTFSAADFSFTDTDSSDSLQSITITQLPVNGELQLNGVTVNANDTIFPSDIGNLTFTPTANINGAASASLQFTVSDGIADSPAQTLTFDITAVNDAPIAPTAEISQFDFTWGGDSIDDKTADTHSLPSGFTLGDSVWVHKSDGSLRKAVKVQISDNGDGTLNFKAIAAAYTTESNWNSLTAGQQDTFFEGGGGTSESVATSDSEVGYGIRDVAVHGGTPVSGFLDSVTGVDIHPFFTAENGVDGAVVGTVSSSDFEGDTLTYSLSNNAGGRFAIDSSTGEITVADSSLLDYETITSHTVTVEVSDGNLTSSQDYSIYLQDTNEAPELVSSLDNPTTAEDAAFSYTLPASAFADQNNDTISFSASLANGDPLPAWLSFDPATRTFSGTPDAPDVGTLSIKITLSDGTDTTDVFWSVEVTEVNDAPTASDNTLTTDEDTRYTLTLADLGYSDEEGDDLSTVEITTLPANGSLALNDVAVTLNQQVSRADIEAGNLEFIPAANENGSGYATIGFKVSDGNSWSDNTYSLTVDVTPVNDPLTAPVAEFSQFDFTWGGASVNVQATDTYTLPSDFTLGDTVWVQISDSGYRKAVQVQISDNGDGTLNFKALAAAYTTLPNWDYLTEQQQADTFFENGGGSPYPLATSNSDSGYGIRDVAVHGGTPVSGFLDSVTGVDIHPFFTAENGVDGAVVGTVSSSDIDGDTLTYSLSDNAGGRFAIDSSTGEITVADSSLLDYETTISHTITVEVSDGNVTTSRDYSIYLQDTNDAPIASDNTLTIYVNVSYTLTLADFGYSDPDGDDLSTIKIFTLPASGTLKLNDVAVTLNQQISRADIEAGNLVFVPAAYEDGNNNPTIGFEVYDGSSWSDNTYELAFNIIPPLLAGSNADDTINGTNMSETIEGYEGDDTIYGDDAGAVSIEFSSDFLAQASQPLIPAASGLQGNVYYTWLDIDEINDAVTWTNTYNPTATFTAQSIDYSHSGSGTMADFLGSDIDSFTSGETSLASEFIMQLSGYIYMEAGTHDFNVSSDDGFRLNINQQIVTEFTTPTSVQTSTGNFTAPQAGLYEVELIYWQGTGEAALNISSNSLGTLEFYTSLPDEAEPVEGQTYYTVPTPDVEVDVADGVTLSAGTNNGDGTWSLKGGDLSGLTMSSTDGNWDDSLTFTASQLETRNVTIDDPSFESISLSNGTWQNQPSGTEWQFSHATNGIQDYNSAQMNEQATDGENAAYINSNNTTISQQLSENFNRDTTYELKVDIGNRITSVGMPTYEVRLKAGGVILASDGSVTPPEGEFETLTLSLDGSTIDADSAAVGEPITIEVIKFSGEQLVFDNVRMTATSPEQISQETVNTDMSDQIIGGEGNDILIGGNDSDIFIWQAGDDGTTETPAEDTITDFHVGQGGDVLDLSDMLVDELNHQLSEYLHFNFENGDTTLEISPQANGDVTQRITLQGVDLSSLGTSDTEIINSLLRDGNLQVDSPWLVLGLDNQTTAEDVAFSYTLPASAFADQSNDTISFSASQANGDPLPAWLNFDPDTQTFSGTPGGSDVGTLSVTITLSDGTDTTDLLWSVEVTEVNDAPTASDNTLTAYTNVSYTLTLADFGYSDEEGDDLSAVRITALPASETLRLNGIAVTLNQQISRAEIEAGNLEFVAAAYEDGNNNPVIGFEVYDGNSWSDNTYDLTFNIQLPLIVGTNADDTINGTHTGEMIEGYEGDDTIYGDDDGGAVSVGLSSDFIAQASQPIIPAATGLHGVYYHTYNWNNFEDLSDAINYANTSMPVATFTAQSIDYSHSGDASMADFLGSDGETFGENGDDDAINFLLQLSGYIYMEAGTHDFSISSDDVFWLNIDQQAVINTTLQTSTGNFTAPQDGLYEVELVYWQEDGPAALNISSDSLGTLEFYDSPPAGAELVEGETYYTVPTPDIEVDVADGVTLSAGTNNGDGTWSLQGDDLSGLTMSSTNGNWEESLTFITNRPSITRDVTIDDPSFESNDVTDGSVQYQPSGTQWQYNNAWNGIANYDSTQMSGDAPDGENTAFINYDNTTISQQLTENFDRSNTYELQVDIGNYFLFFEAMPSYEVRLKAGGVTLASDGSVTPAEGQFETLTLSLDGSTIDADSAAVGEPITIEIVKLSGEELIFDNVRMTATSSVEFMSQETVITDQSDQIIGGAGNDILFGGNDSDIFIWHTGDDGTAEMPAEDTITDFHVGQGGDVLDLSDMLVDEENHQLDEYLHFNFENGDTTLEISTQANGDVTQKVTLQGVDLSSLGASDTEIINNLLSDGNLQVD